MKNLLVIWLCVSFAILYLVFYLFYHSNLLLFGQFQSIAVCHIAYAVYSCCAPPQQGVPATFSDGTRMSMGVSDKK